MNNKTIKEKMIAFLHDGMICILIGAIVAIVLTIVLALISGLVSGFEVYTMLNTVRSGLLIVGAIMLFIVAGLLLGQKGSNKIRSNEKWKATYHVMGPAAAFIVVSIVVLTVAAIVDYIVWLS